jgi:hypothetical protein
MLLYVFLATSVSPHLAERELKGFSICCTCCSVAGTYREAFEFALVHIAGAYSELKGFSICCTCCRDAPKLATRVPKASLYVAPVALKGFSICCTCCRDAPKLATRVPKGRGGGQDDA